MINRSSTVMRLNPLTHLFAVWREPLTTGHVATGSVVYVLVCLALLIVASIVTITHLRKAPFWI
jgi:ABC-type polysaccharide/polyol phosphate export permease